MSKPGNALQAVLDRHAATPASPPVAPKSAPRAPRERPPATGAFSRPSRQGTKLIGGHFAPGVAKQLRLLAAEEETTVQALLEEALDLLFVKKGKGALRDV